MTGEKGTERGLPVVSEVEEILRLVADKYKAERQRNDDLRFELSESQRQLEDVGPRIKRLAASLAKSNSLVGERNQRIRELQAENEALGPKGRIMIKETIIEWEGKHRKLSNLLELAKERMHRATVQINDQRKEIDSLKAKLWDLSQEGA